MPSPTRPTFLCASLAACAAGAIYYFPPGGDPRPFEDPEWTERFTVLRDRQQCGDAFNKALAADLAAGQVRLNAAAPVAIEANRDRDDFLPAVRRAFPAPSGEASTAALLIVRAWQARLNEPAQRCAVVRRLAAEYQAVYGVPFPVPEWGEELATDLAGGPPSRTPDRDERVSLVGLQSPTESESAR